MSLQIETVVKYRLPARIAIWGTAKTGKSHAALSLATALAAEEKDGKVGVVSTEFLTSQLLKHRFPHDIINLAEVDANHNLIQGAFSPERYIEAIRLFNREFYNVIVIDSLSHVWEGEGGLLEIASRGGSNSFTDGWGKATPAYKKLVNTILASRAHIIITLRGKDEYKIEEYIKKNNQIGFMPKNVGQGPIIRKGFNYEMHLVLYMDEMVARVEATAMQDYIASGEEFEELGPDLAQRLLTALDGLPPPEPSAQEIAIRDLLDELRELFSPDAIAKFPNWEQLALAKAFNGPLPKDNKSYTDEHVEKLRAHVQKRRLEAEAKAQIGL